MTEQRIEVADVFRCHGQEFLDAHGRGLFREQRRALRDIAICRTAALGGHKCKCDHCDYEEFSYNSCRNIHCPKCQARRRAKWLREQATCLLPVQYFHVVFTLPGGLGPLALQNKRVIYTALFRAASAALLTIGRDPKHLGAELGFLAVLHTWGQNLLLHPHVHCVVPGGGLSPDRSLWISCRKGFFLPVRVLSRFFRGRFLQLLGQSYARGELTLKGRLTPLAQASEWQRFLESLARTEWVVYSKPPFGSAVQVLKYLARYTYRVAIANSRLAALHDGSVTFHWKDYAHGGQQSTMTLRAVEFIRRFLLHVLPAGFVRIRHYGFLANRLRRERIPLLRKLLGDDAPHEEISSVSTATSTSESTHDTDSHENADTQNAHVCPACKKGHLVRVAKICSEPSPFHDFLRICQHDSS